MDTFRAILKTFLFSVLFIIIAVIIFCIFVDTKESKDKKVQKITDTPEMLIVPPTITSVVIEEPTRTQRYIVRQTDTPSAVRGGSIPYYSNDGKLLGFMDNSEPIPTATSILSVFKTREAEFHPTGCDIKGNVSWRNNDEKIYHCPNWRDYDRTDIDLYYGDRWFCSEAEAIAAGFRRPQNVGNTPCIQ